MKISNNYSNQSKVNIPGDKEFEGLEAKEWHQIEGFASDGSVNHQEGDGQRAECDSNSNVQVLC